MIYDNVVEIAVKKNLTIHAVEVKAGLANGTVRKWNTPDANPQMNNLAAVAAVLGVSVNRLLKSKEDIKNARP